MPLCHQNRTFVDTDFIIKVTNKNHRIGMRPPHVVYVGRPSPLANPFFIGRDGTREEVIALYKEWFYARLRNCGDDHPFIRQIARCLRVIRNQGRLELECFCAPRSCHAEVILLFLANQKLNRSEMDKKGYPPGETYP